MEPWDWIKNHLIAKSPDEIVGGGAGALVVAAVMYVVVAPPWAILGAIVGWVVGERAVDYR